MMDDADIEHLIARLAETTKVLSERPRLEAVVRVLHANTDRIQSSAAFPGMSASLRNAHLDKLRPYFDISRPAKNKEALYKINPRVRAPLQDVINALDRLSTATGYKSSVTVSMDDEGGYWIDGRPIPEGKKLGAAIKHALSEEDG